MTEGKLFMKNYHIAILLLAGTFTFSACSSANSSDNPTANQVSYKYEEPKPKMEMTYHFQSMKDSGMKILKRHSLGEQKIILALNRVDRANITGLDSIIVPDKFIDDYDQYSPFPLGVKALAEVNKIIFFSYPAETFAAYEHGKLVKWGPTNMGKKKAQTPTGLFFTNWKAEETQSTVDDEWILKWNFNIANKDGVGFHEYSMPGYPVSHSCLRLWEADAKYLYDWADQWVLANDEKVSANGTPVIVFGNYPFGSQKPWFALPRNPKALEISTEQIEQLYAANKEKILTEQQKLEAKKTTGTK